MCILRSDNICVECRIILNGSSCWYETFLAPLTNSSESIILASAGQLLVSDPTEHRKKGSVAVFSTRTSLVPTKVETLPASSWQAPSGKSIAVHHSKNAVAAEGEPSQSGIENANVYLRTVAVDIFTKLSDTSQLI